MNIYLSYSITAQPDFAQALRDIESLAKHLVTETDYMPWVPHVFTAGSIDRPIPKPDATGNLNVDDKFLYTVDISAARSCDMVLALVDHPSAGMGMEVQTALAYCVPVLFLVKEDVKLTRMFIGATKYPLANCSIVRVRDFDPEEVATQIEFFSHQVENSKAKDDDYTLVNTNESYHTRQMFLRSLLEQKYSALGWISHSIVRLAKPWRLYNGLYPQCTYRMYESYFCPRASGVDVATVLIRDESKSDEKVEHYALTLAENLTKDPGSTVRIVITDPDRGAHHLAVMTWPAGQWEVIKSTSC